MRERGKGMQNCQPHVHRQAGELTPAQWKSGADISVKKHLVLQVKSCNAVIPIAGRETFLLLLHHTKMFWD